MEDHSIPYTETMYTNETWQASKMLGFEDGLYVFGESMLIKLIELVLYFLFELFSLNFQFLNLEIKVVCLNLTLLLSFLPG